MRSPSHRSQRGAVIITVFLLMLFLLGFIGFALDFGKLFVVKGELQTAMDSCALAAAQELDLQPTAIARATSAGKTAGNLNAVNFQSTSWSGKGQVVDADITFKAADYSVTTSPALAQYVECRHVQPAVQLWLLQAMGAFSGNTNDFPNTHNVMASAVATRAHGQSTCPIPVTLKPKECPAGSGTPCPAPHYGLTPGQWITVLTGQSAIPGGYIGWANLDGTNAASETVAEMNGKCGTRVNDVLGTPGTQTNIAEPWNYRFGIYKKLPDFSTDPSYMRPDLSGYSYTSTNWPADPVRDAIACPGTAGPCNAWDGAKPAGAHASADNFVAKRAAFGACSPAGTVNNCESITGLTLNSFKDLAASGAGPSSHGAWGTNRRIVTVPVTDSGNKVIDFACMFMLQPLSIPMTNVQLEYVGNASNPASPCSFSGMPGGVAGPLVPALVR
jgi:Flp pilus assembly protein TadG